MAEKSWLFMFAYFNMNGSIDHDFVHQEYQADLT